MEFYYQTYYLNAHEYAKIISEINTDYEKYKDKLLATHISHDIFGAECVYYFENHGFDNYNIYMKQWL